MPLASTQEAAPVPDGSSAGGRREHRLALVLYGGVSLCIYMHGTTKEVHHLVSASAARAGGGGDDLASSAAVYRAMLDWKANEEGVRTDVVVDVIAGTSAGGINGVYLAKALAENRSQDELRELWLKNADIDLLLHGPKWLPVPLRAVEALATLKSKPALRGDLMSELLYRALVSMKQESSTPDSLIPERSSLDLLVTTTDFYGYNREAPAWDPTSVHDAQHRHVFHFTVENPGTPFGPSGNLALAFAARATSCFPGAFEPVNRRAFSESVGGGTSIPGSLFRPYELAGADVDGTFFIDGGVLDNRPFVPAIEALRAKPADVEIERTLIYLDPDPEPPLPPPPGKVPDVVSTLLGSIAGLPRKQPILDSLLEIDRMNIRVDELREVIEASFQEVSALVLEGAKDRTPGISEVDVPDLERHLLSVSQERVGVSYPTYVRARVTALLDRLSDGLSSARDYPRESTHAMLLALTWHKRAEQRGLFRAVLKETEREHELLRTLDVSYAERRLRFTLAGVNWIYEHAGKDLSEQERLEIDTVKRRLWAAITYMTTVFGEVIGSLEAEIDAAFPEPEMRDLLKEVGLEPTLWLERKRTQIDALAEALAERLGPVLQEMPGQLYSELRQLTAGWGRERRDGVLLRFAGFRLWDATLFPLESASHVGERDEVKVMRSSPPDATLLTQPNDEAKLKGTTLAHFGAFLDLASRENDYLIGRLDGAERLVRMLVPDNDPARIEWTKRAFLAVLAEEEPVLGTAGELIVRLRGRAEALSGRGEVLKRSGGVKCSKSEPG